MGRTACTAVDGSNATAAGACCGEQARVRKKCAAARSPSARARSGREPWGGVLLCLYVCRCALCV